MSKYIKYFLIVIIAIIYILFFSYFIGLIGYKYNIIYENTFSNTSITKVNILINAGNLKIINSNNNDIKITAYGEHKEDINVTINDNLLNINYPIYANSYYNLGNYSCDVILYLPNTINDINIVSDEGDIFVGDFSQSTVNIISKDGSINLGNFNNVYLDYNTLFGNIYIEEVNNKIEANGSGDIIINELNINENSYINVDDLSKIIINQVNDINIEANTNRKINISHDNNNSNIKLLLHSKDGNIIVK